MKMSLFPTRQQALGTNEHFPLCLSFRDETMRAYQAIAPLSISFFRRLACGAHGLVSTNKKAYVRFYEIYTYISVIVDKISILYFISPHLASPYLISPHLTSPHLTSPHLTSPHLTSSHLTSPYVTSPCLTSPHLASPYLTLPHLTLPLVYTAAKCCPLSAKICKTP